MSGIQRRLASGIFPVDVAVCTCAGTFTSTMRTSANVMVQLLNSPVVTDNLV